MIKKLLTFTFAVALYLCVQGQVSACEGHTEETKAAVNKPALSTAINGTLSGWADSSVLEVNTSAGVMTFYTTNRWYLSHLTEGRNYKYFYVNKNGQNIITQIWK